VWCAAAAAAQLPCHVIHQLQQDRLDDVLIEAQRAKVLRQYVSQQYTVIYAKCRPCWMHRCCSLGTSGTVCLCHDCAAFAGALHLARSGQRG
jgi:hypothetical protein